MAIKVPGVRNSKNATTSDVIAEQISLCNANLKSIEEFAFFRKEREKRDEINRRLRGCHDFLGMAGSRKDGCLYREVGISTGAQVVCEHAIPVSALVSLYESGVPFEELVFFPVARISKNSDSRFQKLGLVKSGHDINIPFKRYHKASIEIETHNGEVIDCEKWSISDHWNLVISTPEISRIREEVLQKLADMVPEPA